MIIPFRFANVNAPGKQQDSYARVIRSDVILRENF